MGRSPTGRRANTAKSLTLFFELSSQSPGFRPWEAEKER
jgi:hypothetical protein